MAEVSPSSAHARPPGAGRRWRRLLVAIVLVASATGGLLLRRSRHPAPGGMDEAAGEAGAPATARSASRAPRRPPVFRGTTTGLPAVPSWFAQPDVPAREIAGKVLRQGQAAAGVELTLESQASAANPALRQRAVSQPDGSFTFGAQPAGPYGVTAYAAGSEPAHRWIDPRDPLAEPRADRLLLNLEPCGTTISGLVTDATSGAPLAGARVMVLPVRNPGRLVGPSTLTGSSGDYELCASGDLRLRVEAAGHATALVLAAADARRDVQLEAEAVLIGTTVDKETGAPLGDTQVNAWPLGDGESSAAPSTALSDDRGHFELHGLQAQTRYTINAWRSDFMCDEDLIVRVGPGITTGVVRRLAPASRLSGVIAQQGRRVAGAHLHVERPPYASSFTSISQADGHFTVQGVPRGSGTIVVEGWRVVSPARVEVTEPAQAGVVVEVEPARR